MPRHSFPSSNDTVFWMQCLSRRIGGGGLKLLGHEWVFSRRRDARLEGSLEISRRFSPNVFKWYGATLVIVPTILGGQVSHAVAYPYDSERIEPFVDIAKLFAERCPH